MLDVNLEAAASVAPSTTIDSAIPCRLIEAISVRFLPLLLATLAVSSRSPGSPRPQAVHRDVCPALIHEHKAPNLEAGN